MEILRVEPTPSPHTMKIVLSKKGKTQNLIHSHIEEQQPLMIY